MRNDYFQHPDGAWREKANLVGHIICENEEGVTKEQVWLEIEPKLPNNHARLCCLPFFCYSYALGDILQFDEKTYDIVKKISSSGRSLIRVIFNPGTNSVKIVEQLLVTCCAHAEWASSDYVSLDFATKNDVQEGWEVLTRLEETGQLHFETGSLGYEAS